MIVLIDNGHGAETPGKASPDRRLLEYRWTRDMATALQRRLAALGIEARRIVPETTDVPLATRCRRVNEFCRANPSRSVMLLSLHCNAAGNGSQWHAARGWAAYVALNASAASRRLARLLNEAALARHLRGNRWLPPDGYITQNLAISRDTICPAVLTENLFMDNPQDCSYLLSDAGFHNILRLHTDAITQFINK